MIEVVSLDGAHGIGVWRNVVIQIWEKPMAPAAQRRAFQKTDEAFAALRAKLGPDQRLLAITVVSEQATMPDPDSRKIAAELTRWFDYYVGVHEGSGFRASLVRTVVAGMALVAPRRKPHDICGDLRHGAALLSGRSDGTLVVSDVVSAVSDLRQRVRELPASASV